MKRMEIGKLLKMILTFCRVNVAFPTPLHKESEIPPTAVGGRFRRSLQEFTSAILQSTLESGLLSDVYETSTNCGWWYFYF